MFFWSSNFLKPFFFSSDLSGVPDLHQALNHVIENGKDDTKTLAAVTLGEQLSCILFWNFRVWKRWFRIAHDPFWDLWWRKFSDIWWNFVETVLRVSRSHGAFLTGKLCGGNIGFFIPGIISQLETQSQRQYVLLNSLKEIINLIPSERITVEAVAPYVMPIW